MNSVNSNQQRQIKVQPRGTDTSGSHKERLVLEHIFKKTKVTDYEFTDPNGWARYDAIARIDGKEYMIELKNRNIKSTQYNTIILDEGKVKWMIEECKRTNRIPIFIATFADDKYIGINLFNALNTATKSEVSTPISTADDHRKIKKTMCYFKISNVKELGLFS
jgi:hypothetical protein